jgi:hypothetical protein
MNKEDFKKFVPTVGFVKKHEDCTSAYVDLVIAELVDSYEMCMHQLTVRCALQAKVLVAAVKALSAYGKAEIINGDRLVFIPAVAIEGYANGNIKDFVKKTLTDLLAASAITAEFDYAESVNWINYANSEDGSYTIAASFGKALFNANGELAAQRKARREKRQAADPINKLVDAITTPTK